MSSTIRDLQRQVDALERQIAQPLEGRGEFVAAQSRADRLFKGFGDAQGAPPFVAGERLLQYRARLLSKFQKYSARFKGANLAKVNDAAAFAAVEAEIYADAEHELTHPTNLPDGMLRAVTTHDAAGRPITKFFGDTAVCWAPFKAPVRYVKRWATDKRGL